MADNFTANPGAGGDTFAADDVAGVKVPYSKLDIGADGVSSPVNASNPLPVSGAVSVSNFPGSQAVTGPLTDTQLRATPVDVDVFRYNYPISTVNSSTAQLTAGSSFTGGIEAPQDQPSISILLTSDQPITLRVRQFIDAGGTFAVPDLFFYVAANTGFARSFTVNGNFIQIIATNTGASTTTTFNLNTAFGTLGDADPTGTTPVTELPLVLTGAAAQTATVNNILEPTAGANPTAVSNYRSASVQVVSTGTGGTFIFEQSNDGVSWIALPVFNAALVTGVPITAAITASASQIIYTFLLRCNFVRLRIASTITGGSIRAFSRMSTEPWTAAAQLVASNTAGNLLAQVSGTVTANIGTGSIAAGTNLIGDVGVQLRATTPGTTLANVLSTASNNLTQLKGTAGKVAGGFLTNTTASLQYLKLFALPSASVTMGTTAATTQIALQPNATVNLSQGDFGTFLGGTGVTYAITTGSSLTDNTSTTAGSVVGYILWI